MLKDLQISALTKSDLSLIHQWFNDPVAAGDYDGIPATSFEKITTQFEGGKMKGLRLISFRGEKIGWTEMNAFAESKNSASLTVQISRPEFRGKGLGRRIHELAIKDFLETNSQVQYIEVWTHVHNFAEQKILASLDFIKQEGEAQLFNINGVDQPYISYEYKVKGRSQM